MNVRQRVLAAITLVCALVGVLAMPVRALASDTQQSILMDDDQLIYSSAAHVAQRLAQIHALGVDRVKVSVVWSLVAPDSNSTRRPNFDAIDPRAYPPGAWDRYDRIVTIAHALGMGVYFQLSPPVPVWALPRHQTTRQGPVLGHAPNARQFGEFAAAVGRRYDGTFVTTLPRSQTDPSLLGITLPIGSQPPPTGAAPLPRVDYWGIWNEPNERSWLNPWWRSLGHGRKEMLQPATYRSLVDGAWGGLVGTGHLGDTILIGETANKGIMQPLPFIHGLYCVNGAYQPMRGNTAREFGCPTSGDRAAFVRAHPGLFGATGYAHHPYTFDAPPSTPNHDLNVIALSSLNTFERQISRMFGAYGIRRSGGIPLYMTEWGYKTRPPNPYVKTSLAQQAAWLNQGEYMTYQNPYVQALTQFELVDSPPKAGEREGTRGYWSSFQTGLLYQDGTPKPSYDTFRIPIWVPSARHGSRVTVWGQLRPADHSTVQYGVIEYRRAGSGSWDDIREVQTDSPEGFVLAHVALPAAGAVRLAWLDPSGRVFYSREVSIR